jgi:hypothetical protein
MKPRVTKFFLVLILTVSTVVTGIFGRVPLGSIKGVEKKIKPEYLRITPLVGIGPWHTGWIRNIAEYDDGGMGQLVRALFHEVQGQFTVTQNDSYPAKHFSPQLISKIIIEIEEYIKIKYPPNVSLKLKKSLLRSRLHSLIIADKNIKRAEVEVQKKYDNIQKKIDDFNNLKKKIDRFLKTSKDPLNRIINSVKNELIEKNIIIPELKKIKFQELIKILKEYLVGKYSEEISKLLKEKVNKSNQELEKAATRLKRKIRRKLKQYRGTENIFKQLQKKYKELLENKTPYVSLQENIAKQKTELTKNNPKKLKGELLDNLLDGIIKAIHESGYFDDEPNLFRYGLHVVFMAFLYEKFDSKKDYQDYLREFDEKYFTEGGKVAILKKEWVSDLYKKGDLVEFEKKFNENDLPFEQYVYAQAMKAFFLLSFPNTVEYRKTKYKEFNFPDCVETAARNVILCALYDSDQARLDTGLNVNWSIDEALKKYVGKYPDVMGAGRKMAYEDWAEVVENREWLSYYLVSVDPDVRVVSRDKLGNGFIPIPDLKNKIKELRKEKDIDKDIEISEFKIGKQEFTRLKVGERIYFLFDSRSKVISYELIPSLRNFIMLFNRFFGLQAPKKLSLKETLLRRDFNSYYASAIFKKLGFKNVVMPIDTKLDNDDFVDGKVINIEVKAKTSILDIMLKYGHGQADTKRHFGELKNPFDMRKKIVSSIKKDDNVKLDFKTLQYLIINNPGYGDIVTEGLYKIKGGKTKFRRWLYFFPLAEKNKVSAMMLTFDFGMKKLTEKHKDVVKRLVIKLINNMAFVDGEAQREIVNDIGKSKAWIDIMKNKKYAELREKSFENPSFLYCFFFFLQHRDRKFPWEEIKKALKKGMSSKYRPIFKMAETEYYPYLSIKKPGLIEHSQELINNGLQERSSLRQKRNAIRNIEFAIDNDLIESLQEQQKNNEQIQILKERLREVAKSNERLRLKQLLKEEQDERTKKISYDYFNKLIPKIVKVSYLQYELSSIIILNYIFIKAIRKNFISRKHEKIVLDVARRASAFIKVYSDAEIPLLLLDVLFQHDRITNKGVFLVDELFSLLQKINRITAHERVFKILGKLLRKKNKYVMENKISDIISLIEQGIKHKNSELSKNSILKLFDHLIALKLLNPSQIMEIAITMLGSPSPDIERAGAYKLISIINKEKIQNIISILKSMLKRKFVLKDQIKVLLKKLLINLIQANGEIAATLLIQLIDHKFITLGEGIDYIKDVTIMSEEGDFWDLLLSEKKIKQNDKESVKRIWKFVKDFDELPVAGWVKSKAEEQGLKSSPSGKKK